MTTHLSNCYKSTQKRESLLERSESDIENTEIANRDHSLPQITDSKMMSSAITGSNRLISIESNANIGQRPAIEER